MWAYVLVLAWAIVELATPVTYALYGYVMALKISVFPLALAIVGLRGEVARRRIEAGEPTASPA